MSHLVLLSSLIVTFSEFWADVHLTVNVEVVSQDFERAVGFFANVILDDANGCQGSNRLLLRRIVFGFRSGYACSRCSLCTAHCCDHITVRHFRFK